MKKLVLLILALVVCAAAVWLGTRYKPTSAVQNGEVAQSTDTKSVDAADPSPEENGKTPRAFRHHMHSKDGETDPMDVWDKQVDAILTSPGTDAEIADKLLALYPQLPTNGQADLFVEIVPRIANTNYSKLANVMTNVTTPADVLDTLFTDAIDRPDSVRMPVLLDVARNQDNPKSEAAHDLLEVLLGDDYGDDWNLWSKKIAEWTASHPEE